MIPVKFKEATHEFAKDQPQYGNLPALILKGDQGECVFCWKANIFERIQILFTGKVWLSISSFKKPLMPSYVSAFRKGVYTLPTDWRIGGFVTRLLTKKSNRNFISKLLTKK
ncbi:MAG: hypothetical protein GY834_07915 [Bacteroidetes bacterium]|nr:hypothetical protein [Bacteroidota bacterium]